MDPHEDAPEHVKEAMRIHKFKCSKKISVAINKAMDPLNHIAKFEGL